MRLLSIVAVAAVVVSLAGFAQSIARAAPPVDVSIQVMPTTFFPVEAGTWSASGAISDSGTYVRTDFDGTGSLPDCFCPPVHTGAFREVFLLAGSKGTLTIREEALQKPGGGFSVVTGGWEVASGTGAYDSASGHGTDEFNGPTLTLLLTGVISKAD
jgi:hypothetical protein